MLLPLTSLLASGSRSCVYLVDLNFASKIFRI